MSATYSPPAVAEADPVALAAVSAEAVLRASGDATSTAAVASLNTAIGLKQDASTAATDMELAAAVALDRARLDAVESAQLPRDQDGDAVPGYRLVPVIQTSGGVPVIDPDGTISIDDLLIEAVA